MNDQENVSVNQVPNNVSNEVPNVKSKSKVGIIAIIVVVIVALIGIGGFLFYRSVMLKNPLKTLIHNTLSYVEKNMNEPKSEIGSFSLKVSGNSSNSNFDKIFSIISKIGIKVQYGVDYTNKLIDFDIDTTYDNKKLVNANAYYENSAAYFDLEGIFDKYISVPIENYNEVFDTKSYVNEYKTILHSFDQVLEDVLKDEYFVKEKVSLDGKNVDKTTLHLDSKNYETIKKEVLNRLLEDNKFIESVASVCKTNTKDVIDTLNKAKDNKDKFEGIDISIYTSGFNWLQIEIVESSDKILIKNGDSKKYVNYYQNDNLLFEMTIEIKGNEKKGNSIITLSDNKQNLNMTINVDYSYENGKTIEKKDVSNSISVGSISEEELQGIYTKMLENEGVITLIQEISKISNNWLTKTLYEVVFI